jgi:hypothetical protein
VEVLVDMEVEMVASSSFHSGVVASGAVVVVAVAGVPLPKQASLQFPQELAMKFWPLSTAVEHHGCVHRALVHSVYVTSL